MGRADGTGQRAARTFRGRDGAIVTLIRERPAPGTARRVCARADHDYPSALRDLRDAPERVAVWGGALPAREAAVAIVGARAATPYGRTFAHRLAHDLAARGLAVVSGLAHGIDAAAHEGALAAGARTVAVIASSFECVTPADHAGLARRIARAGAVMSEVPEGGPFGRGAFVKRNRLIAALAAATVVVEAGETSGALRTAAVARELGRLVFAVPADVDRPTSRGTLALLRSGALVCADAGDVLARLAPPRAPAGDPESRLLAALSARPATVESLAAASALDPADALARLLRLAWSGLAVSHPGGRWSART